MRTFPVFALLFFVIPLIEIYFLVKVGEHIGALLTIFFVVLTAVIGAFLLRQQGMATLGRFQKSVSSGKVPAQEIIEAFMLLVGGILLMTPGFFTDAIGFLCLIPFTLTFFAKRLALRSNVAASPFSRGGGFRAGQHNDTNVYDGEYTRKDDQQLSQTNPLDKEN